MGDMGKVGNLNSQAFDYNFEEGKEDWNPNSESTD